MADIALEDPCEEAADLSSAGEWVVSTPELAEQAHAGHLRGRGGQGRVRVQEPPY